MNAPRDFLAPTTALRRLADFLHESGSPLAPAEAATQAIAEWIAAAKGHYQPIAPTPTRGYQWKSLFLPEGTELRLHYAGQGFYARVTGDAIFYQGERVSPRQFTLAVAGDGRNAWRELWLLFPGETKWKPALLLRREGGHGAPKQVSPVEAMMAAAACMSETLKTALALVDHANAIALPNCERRQARHRRTTDVMEEACKLD